MRYLTLFESFNDLKFDEVNTFFIFSESVLSDDPLYEKIHVFISKLGYNPFDFTAIGDDEISKRNILAEEFLRKLRSDPEMIKEFISLNKEIYDKYLNYYPDLIDVLTLFDDLLSVEKTVSYYFTIKNDRIELSFDNVQEKYRPHYFEGKVDRIERMFGNKCKYEFDKKNRWNFGDIIIIYKKV